MNVPGDQTMALGCVVRTPAEVDQAASLAVDYLEVKGDLLCDADPADLARRLRATGRPAVAMTSPLPRRYGCRVVGPDADLTRALAVFTDLCERGVPLGVALVVLGSGQARAVPPGFPVATARDQLSEFLARAADVAAVRGMSLTLEPLAAAETNLVNSCAEARPLVDGLGGRVRIAVDCFHIYSEGLPVRDEVRSASGVIGHAHTSSLPRGSMRPCPEVQAEFATALRAAGHTGGLTIEDDFADLARQAPPMVAELRRTLAVES